MENKDKNTVVIERIKSEIEKINKKENKVFFFVLDTKGNPSGSLEYIYKLALLVKEEGHNVSMLYQEDKEFVGVKDWLGEEYANLPHENIAADKTSVSPSDILFIPEIFSNVMTQAKTLPCKKVAILQNYDFISEQIPLSVQWGDFNVMDAIVNTKSNAELLHMIFPYVKSTVVQPYIDNKFYVDKTPKEFIINIVSKNPSNINRIVKPFYWAFPAYKWVTFRDLRGLPQDEFAKRLREGAMTLWVDEDASFGYGALEAMKSGSLVIAKLPSNKLPWMVDEEGNLSDCCVWFDNIHQLPKLIANFVRAWITDNTPSKVAENGKKVADEYTREVTKGQIIKFVEDTLAKRVDELNKLIDTVKDKKNK